MYAKIVGGIVTKYPYTYADARLDYPNTSLPTNLSEGNLAEFNIYKIADVATPTFDTVTQTVAEVTPTQVAGVWSQTWQIVALDAATIAANQAAVTAAVNNAALLAIAKADPTITYLLSHTAAEIQAKITTDVVDLPTARTMLSRFALALAFLARNSMR
jgi:hypothetical protein